MGSWACFEVLCREIGEIDKQKAISWQMFGRAIYLEKHEKQRKTKGEKERQRPKGDS
jgi:hypothetical protein